MTVRALVAMALCALLTLPALTLPAPAQETPASGPGLDAELRSTLPASDGSASDAVEPLPSDGAPTLAPSLGPQAQGPSAAMSALRDGRFLTALDAASTPGERAAATMSAGRIGLLDGADEATLAALRTDLLQAFENGEPRAAVWLARLAEGRELTADEFREAAERLADAAASGDAVAANALSEVIFAAGTADDRPRAVELMRDAAVAGLPEAQLRLGLAHRLGRGVDIAPERAADWLRRASEAGLPEAQLHYGVALITGEGVERDAAAGAALLRLAAIRGNKLAQNRYARALAQGVGVDTHAGEAAFWHVLARQAAPDQDGVSDPALDGFLASVPPEELARARDAAATFHPSPSPADAPGLLALPGYPGFGSAALTATLFPPA